MLDLQKFSTNFEELIKRLEPRGISKEQLLVIQKKLTERSKLISRINYLRHQRNSLSKEGKKNSDKVIEINELITSHEAELNELEAKLNELTRQLPNLPAPGAPTN